MRTIPWGITFLSLHSWFPTQIAPSKSFFFSLFYWISNCWFSSGVAFRILFLHSINKALNTIHILTTPQFIFVALTSGSSNLKQKLELLLVYLRSTSKRTCLKLTLCLPHPEMSVTRLFATWISGAIIQLIARNRNTGTLLKLFIFLISHIKFIRKCCVPKFSDMLLHVIISNSTEIPLFPVNITTWLDNCNGHPASFCIHYTPLNSQDHLLKAHSMMSLFLVSLKGIIFAFQIQLRLLLRVQLESFLGIHLHFLYSIQATGFSMLRSLIC